MYKCRPRFNISASEYRPDAPQQDANVSLEPYVRESNTPAPVPLHTRLPRRLPVLTPEPPKTPKPAVTSQDEETQTEPVVVTPAREVAAQELYMSHVRNGAAELRSDKIRLQREVDALTLAMQKLSAEVHTARSAEERRLAEDKRRREQLERAEEQTRREQLERAARSAEERRLADDKRRLELERAAEERRLAEEKSAEQRRLAEATRLEQLERDREARERLQRLLPRVQPAGAAARRKPATPAQPPVRTRTLNRAAK
jgi:hypothetical protein